MKKIVCVFLSVFFALHLQPGFAASNTPYEWNSLPIGGHGFVTGLVMHPMEKDLMYIRTDVGGAYRWDKNTNSWIQLCDLFGVEDKQLYSIDGIALDPQDPDMVYIAAGNYTWETGDVLKSADRGKTWVKTHLNKIFNGNGDARGMGECIAVDPVNSSVIYCGTAQQGLWRSIDRAATWQQVRGIGSTTKIRNIVFDKNTVSGGSSRTIYAGIQGAGVFRSTDGGNVWELINGTPAYAERMEIGSSGALYIASKTGLFKFANNVLTEISPSDQFGKEITAVAVDPDDENILMCVAYGTDIMSMPFYRSTDGGKTWVNKLSTAQYTTCLPWEKNASFSANTHDIKIDPFNTKRIFMTDWFQVYSTDNIDAQPKQVWGNLVKGLEEVVPRDAISPPTGRYRLMTGIADIDGLVYDDITQYPTRMIREKRQTGYEPWMMSTSQIDYCQEDPNIVLRVGIDWNTNGKAEYSTDGTANWTNITNIPKYTDTDNAVPFGRAAISAQKDPNTGKPPIVLIPAYDTTSHSLPSGTAAVPIVSNNMGSTWQQANFPDGIKNIMDDYWDMYTPIASDRVNGSKFYICANNNVYVSSDWGFNWKRTVSLGGNALTTCIRTAPGMEGEVWVSMEDDGNGNGNQGLYRSRDSGKTFNKLQNVSICMTFGFGKGAPGQNNPALYVFGNIDGVLGMYRSIDMGVTWVRINDDTHKFANISSITGDSRTFGLIYVACAGRGYYVGMPEGTVLGPRKKNYYIGSFSTGIKPDGWSGNFIVDANKNITNVDGTSANQSFTAIYDSKIWNGSLDYSAVVNNTWGANGNKAILYFNYQDENNYYYLSMGGGTSNVPIELGKKVGGGSLIPIASCKSFPIQSYTIRIQYEKGGYMKVTASKSGITTTLFDGVQDSTFTSGKVGVGTAYSVVTFGSIKMIAPNSGVMQDDFSDTGLSSFDWSSSTYAAIGSGKMNVATPSSTFAEVHFDRMMATKNYTYSVDMQMGQETTSNSYGSVIFNLTPHSTYSSVNDYYIVQFYGSQAGDSQNGNVKLVRKYNNVETVLSSANYSMDEKNIRVIIGYELVGYVSVDCIDKATGIKTNLFNRIDLNSLGAPVLGPGKVGLASYGTAALFENVCVDEEPLMLMDVNTICNNQPITSLKTAAGKEVTVSSKLQSNLICNNTSGKYIVVLKDEQGIVNGISTKDFVVSAMSNSGITPMDVSANLYIPADTAQFYKIEAYYWNDINKMIPLTSKRTIIGNEN